MEQSKLNEQNVGQQEKLHIPVVINWVAIKDELPNENRLLITWSDKTSSYRICRYMKALTWKGYKYKFVNVNSKGVYMWDEDATHWTYFPKPPCL